ncbi:MAG: hypothetical protein CMP45_08705 [Rickettsiales bacterium]|nr:hypothetical protein [Rickettsiales bacterium]
MVGFFLDSLWTNTRQFKTNVWSLILVLLHSNFENSQILLLTKLLQKIIMSSSKLLNLRWFYLIFRGLTLILMFSIGGIILGEEAPKKIHFKKTSSGLDIYFGQKAVAEFSHTQTPLGRPFLCNIHTLDGIKVTRNYPITDKDQDDHPHHQGLFHTFSKLNGIDFWHMKGVAKHRLFTDSPESGNPATFTAESVYLDRDGKSPLLKETMRYAFHITDQGLLISVNAIIEAEADKVTIGSKEEGGLAVRVASDLRVQKGGKMIDNQGRDGGKAIWGKAARWVDNSGNKEGRWVGVTLFASHSDLGVYHWHARDYGLITANPFGPLNKAPDKILKKGEKLSFNYGLMVHSHQKASEYSPKRAEGTYLKNARSFSVSLKSMLRFDDEPLFNVWDEEVLTGQVVVAMDGSVLVLKNISSKTNDTRYISVKRSVDGGKTWAEEKKVGDMVKVDGDMSDDGRYPNNNWAGLGNVMVDEVTGDIMVFLTTLKTAQKLYRSTDHGKTWKIEDTTIRPGKDGWVPATNGACDPGVTIKFGSKKGRLLMPARVFPEYLNKGKGRKRFNDLYAMALYSDDRGKTWNSSAPFPIAGTGESGLVELKGGRIYHNSRTHIRSGNRRIAFSEDSGETWYGEHEDDELFDGPPDVYGCKAGLLRLPYKDKDILLFSSPGNRETRTDINVWVSYDGGQTWPVNKLIKKGPGNYTWMAAGRNGTPSEGMIYLLAGKDWMARFNLAWLLEKA